MNTIPKPIKTLANSYARERGYGRATDIVFNDNISEPKIKERIDYGYRKYTTGEYVPKSYLTNFGWKNTYYQHAVTVVELPSKYMIDP